MGWVVWKLYWKEEGEKCGKYEANKAQQTASEKAGVIIKNGGDLIINSFNRI